MDTLVSHGNHCNYVIFPDKETNPMTVTKLNEFSGGNSLIDRYFPTLLFIKDSGTVDHLSRELNEIKVLF